MQCNCEPMSNSILAQNKPPLGSPPRLGAPRAPTLRTRVATRSPTANPGRHAVETGRLAIELGRHEVDQPSQVRPKPDDPSLRSTWAHRAWVASGCATVLVSLAKSSLGAAGTGHWVEPALAALAGYAVSDLASGVYHWGVDNYGDASTPVFGSQIAAFQGHHRYPWTITRRQFANNMHALARAVTFTVLPAGLLLDDPTWLGFVGACAGCIMFSQQFHAWAHSTKSRLPPAVVALQDGGVLVSRSQHAAHHREPYNGNYCIVSGVWNEFLDDHKVFEALEMVLFFKLGVRPRSWSEPGAEWTEEAETA